MLSFPASNFSFKTPDPILTMSWFSQSSAAIERAAKEWIIWAVNVFNSSPTGAYGLVTDALLTTISRSMPSWSTTCK